MKKTTKSNLVSISQYVKMVRKTAEGKNCTPQTIHKRKRSGHIDFIFDGIKPEYKIDISKYPPEKYKRMNPGPRKKTK